MLAIPHNLLDAARQENRTDWLGRLPLIVAELSGRWSLEVGAPFQPGGQTAWVAPVRDASGRALVIKIGWPHFEAADEAAGLAAWRGGGTVLLHAAETLADANALLLERCLPGSALSSRPEAEQDEVVAALLSRLWIRPPDRTSFRPLADMCTRWADSFEAGGGSAALDPGLAREGIALFRELPASATRSVLLCTDLHAGNVLAAERERWLAIDPKPYVGDPTYDVLQHMLNCAERLHADPLGFVRRMAELTAVDAERLRLWLFARCVQESREYPQLAAVAVRLARSRG